MPRDDRTIVEFLLDRKTEDWERTPLAVWWGRHLEAWSDIADVTLEFDAYAMYRELAHIAEEFTLEAIKGHSETLSGATLRYT